MDTLTLVSVIVGVVVGLPLLFLLIPLTGLAPRLWEDWFARVVRRLKNNGGKRAFDLDEIVDGLYLGTLPRAEANLLSLKVGFSVWV